MLDWLFEHSRTVWLLLGSAAVVLAIVWRRTGQRRVGQAFGAVAALLVIFLLSGLFWESPAQQMERKIKAMAAAVQAGNVKDVMDHVSADFHKGSADKEALRGVVEGVLRTRPFSEVKVWGFERAEVHRPRGAPATATIEFQVKPKGEGVPEQFLLRCRATFVRDPDGQWRLQTFELYPFKSEQPLGIPGLGD